LAHTLGAGAEPVNAREPRTGPRGGSRRRPVSPAVDLREPGIAVRGRGSGVDASRPTHYAAPEMSTPPTPPALAVSRGKRALFIAMAVALPFVGIFLLELALDARQYDGDLALFDGFAHAGHVYLRANPHFGARYFPEDSTPPAAGDDAFLYVKPAHAFRVFVLGESTTAGFPFVENGTFSRVVGDALTDLLPSDTVEVVNVGIAATDSYSLIDELPSVLAQQPDAVLIYLGHSEYYGAFGAGSTDRLGTNPALVRLALRLQQYRTVMLLRDCISAVANLFSPRARHARTASRMEEAAGDLTIRLGDATYRDGVNQFESNLDHLLGALHAAGVPTWIGSQASNLRDQPPFGSDSGSDSINANAAFADGRRALAAGDSATALRDLTRARDLDLVRFRAPSEFNDVIRRAAAAHGATYVPVAEAFAAASPAGVPGNPLFFENVHPKRDGVVLMARQFVEAMVARPPLRGRVVMSRLDSWPNYERRMALTPVDLAMADLSIAVLTHRWPFVPESRSTDYLESYVPTTLPDSMALAWITTRVTWTQVKLALAQRYEADGKVDSAVAEYRSLIRDQPWTQSGYEFAARALLDAKRVREAEPFLERAYAINPSAWSCYQLGLLAAGDSTALPHAAAMLRQSLALAPKTPEVLFAFSRVELAMHDTAAARKTAATLARIDPKYPGLDQLLVRLGT